VHKVGDREKFHMKAHIIKMSVTKERNMTSLQNIFFATPLNGKCIFNSKLVLFILLTITSPYFCDSSDSNLSTAAVNVTNNFISNGKTSGKSGIESSSSINSNNMNSNSISSSSNSVSNSGNAQTNIITNDDVPNGHQQIPLVRLPSNTLLKYTAYKDVSIQHFLMPTDTRSAVFSFKSYEESKSALSE
jgi:hypothetical protein